MAWMENFVNVARAMFLGSNRFLFTSISKFGSFKNAFAMITILPELLFRCRFSLQVQAKVKTMEMNEA